MAGKEIRQENEIFSFDSVLLESWEVLFVTKVTSANCFSAEDLFSWFYKSSYWSLMTLLLLQCHSSFMEMVQTDVLVLRTLPCPLGFLRALWPMIAIRKPNPTQIFKSRLDFNHLLSFVCLIISNFLCVWHCCLQFCNCSIFWLQSDIWALKGVIPVPEGN